MCSQAIWTHVEEHDDGGKFCGSLVGLIKLNEGYPVDAEFA